VRAKGLSRGEGRGTVRGMNPVGQRKCCHCKQFFVPDPRQRQRQRYCVAPTCRRASKAASQEWWLARPENRDYFRGPENVARVQAWRAANPGYRPRCRRKQGVLQEMMNLQVAPGQEPAARDERVVLQETWRTQPPLLLGLIAHLAGAALQEELVALMRKLRRKPAALAVAGKSAAWKLAVATDLKDRTTVTNRWLATAMHLGNMHEVSRKVSAWARRPDSSLLKKLQ